MLSGRNVISAMALTPFATSRGTEPAMDSTVLTDTPSDVALAKLVEGNAGHAKGEYSEFEIVGAGNRIRTRGPLITNQVLYQLSYAGTGRFLRVSERHVKPAFDKLATG